MQSNFDQSRPGEKPTEVESLLTAFYTEQPPDIDWANRLWTRLEPQLKTAPHPTTLPVVVSNSLERKEFCYA